MDIGIYVFITGLILVVLVMTFIGIQDKKEIDRLKKHNKELEDYLKRNKRKG